MLSGKSVDTLELGDEMKRRYFPSFSSLQDREVRLMIGVKNEVLPRADNCISLSNEKDILGRNKPLIKLSLSLYEQNGIDLGLKKAQQILSQIVPKEEILLERNPQIINAHIKGTARMGKDPSISVVNEFCQCHDIENMYIVGASSFVRGTMNPTLTVAAISLRAADHIISRVS